MGSAAGRPLNGGKLEERMTKSMPRLMSSGEISAPHKLNVSHSHSAQALQKSGRFVKGKKLEKANQPLGYDFLAATSADDLQKLSSYEKEMLLNTWVDMTTANPYMIELAYERILDSWPALRIIFDSGPEQRAVGDRRLRQQTKAMQNFLGKAVHTLHDAGPDAVISVARDLGRRHVSLYRTGFNRGVLHGHFKPPATISPTNNNNAATQMENFLSVSSKERSSVSTSIEDEAPPQCIVAGVWMAFCQYILKEIHASLAHHDIEWHEHNYLVWVNFLQPLVCAVRDGYEMEMIERDARKECRRNASLRKMNGPLGTQNGKDQQNSPL